MNAAAFDAALAPRGAATKAPAAAVCGHCCYYVKHEHYAQCRRHPPVVVMRDDKVLVDEWPRPLPGQWCGEFRRERPVA